MTHNILPPATTVGVTNKYSTHFRNQINQHSAAAAAAAAQSTTTSSTADTAPNANATASSSINVAPPDVLNVNQNHHHHHAHLPMHHHQHTSAAAAINNENIFGASNYINLNIASASGNNQPSGNNNACGQSSTANCNINLELNELRPSLSTKMQAKCTTGGNKRIRQLRERDQNIVSANQQAAAAAAVAASMGNTTNACGIDLNLASTAVNRSDSK